MRRCIKAGHLNDLEKEIEQFQFWQSDERLRIFQNRTIFQLKFL